MYRPGRGFTIVELLIVIVVIAILAAITIVAYNGIQQQARSAAMTSALQQTTTWLDAERAKTGGVSYPTTLSGLTQNSSYTYEYILEEGAYCTSVSDGKNAQHVVSRNKAAKYPGPCPAGHWRLAGDGNDSGLYGKDGAVVGSPQSVANQQGAPNAAYEFASGRYVTMTDSFWGTQFDISSGGFTLAAWVKVSSYPGQRMTIIGQDYSSSMFFGIVSSGRLLFRMDDSLDSAVSNTPLPVNEWVHVAVSYDRDASGLARYYVNGVQDGSVTVSDLYIDQNGRLSIARQTRTGSGADSPFSGSISDVHWYKRVLTSNEVLGLYDATK